MNKQNFRPKKANPLQLTLHRKQGLAFQSLANEVLFGGAVGGGKSYIMRAAAIIWCAEIPGLQVYLFRRLFPDLIKNHLEGPKGLRGLLSEWCEAGLCKIVEDEVRFWNGSKIYLCHCKDEKDRFKYQGAEIHVLLIDEVTHFTEAIYRFLRTRVRATGLTVPDKYRGRFPRILCSGNPGGVGHQFIKRMFVDPKPALEIWQTEPSEGGMVRQYIPAKLEDNPSMMLDDPLYGDRVSGVGSPEYVKALLEGDWSVVHGAFYPEFGFDHIVEPSAIQAHWSKVRSFDWGSSKPFCCHWWAISDGTEVEEINGQKEYVPSRFPRDSLICYREWYGAQSPNVGLKMQAEDVAKGIIRRSGNEDYVYSVADPSIFKVDGGPSIAEVMARQGVRFRRGDNNRVAGWEQLRIRLKGKGDGSPLIYFFNTCTEIIRTLPSLQHDEIKTDDVDTDLEDHAADSVRYLVMSRPIGLPPKSIVPVKVLNTITFNELLEDYDKGRSRRYF